MVRSLAAMWRLVMDSDSNPLMRIPKMQRFQMMQVLAYMWSLVFAAWVGSALIFGVSRVGHAILLIGVFLDRDYLTAGQAWPELLERQLRTCRAVAVCLGPVPPADDGTPC